MKKFLILLLVSIPVFATQLKFINSNQEVFETIDITDTVSINQTTGDITVRPETEFTILNNQSGFVSLYSDTDYRANVNDTVTITWSKAFVENCVASVPVGNGSNANWNGAKNSANGIHSQQVTLDVLPKTFNLVCDSALTAIPPAAQSITFVEDVVVTGSKPTVTMSATPQTLSGGGNSQISWTVGNNADSCTASGGWSGTKASANGTHQQNVTVGATSTYALSCQNSFGTTNANVTVTVNASVDPVCSNFNPPPGTTDDNAGITFEGLTTGGASIGSAQALSINFEVSRNKYWAIRTDMPSTSMSRKESFTEPFGNTTRAGYTVSLSKCPGDFSGSSQTTNGRCVVSGGNVSLRWTTDQSQSPTFRCIVEPGETYYLNVIHSLSTPYSTTDCSDTECGVLFQETLD